MNYDQMYKKAQEWMKSVYPELSHEKQMLAEKFFPELKESEDERIRKEIIDYIKTGTYHKSWIAWLEKQGEKEKDILEDAILDGNEDGLVAETIRYKNEKQGEKKPTDSYCQENCKGFQETGKCFADGDCKAKKEAEQKPVWSENDERICQCLIRKQEELIDTVDNPILKEIYRERTDWLKSLEGRVQSQKQWKPSDEQMMALRWVLNHIPYDSHKEEISGLLEQLKKLKEE